MRTVWLHFADEDRQAIARSLEGAKAVPQHDAPWIYPSLANPVIYIDWSSDHLELSPEKLAEFAARIGSPPATSLYLDVTGRVSGRPEVSHVAEYLLSRHSGLAHDEYSNHSWSAEEIRADSEVSGARFFHPHA